MILKLQQGGLPPFLSYEPITVTGGNSSPATGGNTPKSSSKSSSDSGELTNKDILNLLDKVNGLQGDMSVVYKSLNNLLVDMQYGYTDTNSLATRYLSILHSIKQANNSKARYDKIFQKADADDSLSELAIDDRGRFFCYNSEKDDFQKVKLEELQDIAKKGYAPLTNSELLSLRNSDPKQFGNDQILDVVANGMSLPKISSMINTAIGTLGSSTKELQGTIAIQNKQVLAGLEFLKMAVAKDPTGVTGLSIDGLYKADLLTTDQADQAKAALLYLRNVLPENAKTFLKLKSDGTREGMDNLLIALLTSKMSDTYKFNPTLQNSGSGSGSGSGSKSSKGDEKTLAESFLLDRGVEMKIPVRAGTADTLQLQAYRMPIMTREGNPLGITTLDKVANDSSFGGIFDFQHVSVGDQILDMASLPNVVADLTALYKVYLPYDQTKAAQGIITPNLNYLALLEKVRNEIKETGATTPEEINAIYQKANLPPFVDAQGQVNEQFYKPFGVLQGAALDQAFSASAEVGDSIHLDEISDENTLLNYWSILKGDKADKQAMDINDAWIEGDYDAMYQGLIYLPIVSTNPMLGSYSSGEGLSNSEYTQTLSAWQQFQKQQEYKPQGQLQL